MLNKCNFSNSKANLYGEDAESSKKAEKIFQAAKAEENKFFQATKAEENFSKVTLIETYGGNVAISHDNAFSILSDSDVHVNEYYFSGVIYPSHYTGKNIVVDTLQFTQKYASDQSKIARA